MLKPLYATPNTANLKPVHQAPLLLPPEAPEFSLSELIEQVMQYCSMRRENPVRFLKLEGDEEKGFVPGYWRPNLLRGCQAKQAYKVHKVPTVEPEFDVQKQFQFDRGNVFEAWLVAYLEAAEAAGVFGITNVRRNLTVHHDLSKVGGKYDIVFTRFGFDYLVEIKSKEDSKAFKAINAPTDDHKAQNNDYMAMTGIHAGFVAYIGIQIGVEDLKTGLIDKDKTAIKIKAFFRRYDPALWAQTLDRTGVMEWFREDPSVLPPKSSRPYFECDGCPYKGVCDLNLSPLAAIASLKFQGK